ncbi:hypothetical protein D3C75_444070 [compost metagenome]
MVRIYIVGDGLPGLPEIVCLALVVLNAVGLRNIRIQRIIFLPVHSHIPELDAQIVCGCFKQDGIVACVQMNTGHIPLLKKFIPGAHARERYLALRRIIDEQITAHRLPIRSIAEP